MADEKQEKETVSYDDGLMADAMAAYKEVADKPEAAAEPPAKAAAEPAEKPADKAAADPGKDKAPADKQAKDDNRDPATGRFVPKDKGKEPDKATEQPGKAAQADPAAKAAEDQPKAEKAPAATSGGPPPSWGVKAKAAWDGLPDAVRAEIAKRETEVAQGLSGLKDFKELKPWVDRAAQSGSTLPQVLHRVAQLEQTLAQDIGAGIAVILQNRGYSREQAAQLFGQLAVKYGAQAPQSNGGQPGAGNGGGSELENLFRPILAPIMQRVEQLHSAYNDRQTADRNAALHQQQTAAEQTIATFKADPANRYYDNVEDDIVRLLETGMVPRTGNFAADLKVAYETAVRMNPEIQEALIEQRLAGEREAQRKKEQEAAEKAKAASRSISGNRMPGTSFKPKDQPQGGGYDQQLLADVQAAYRSHAAA